MAGPLHTLAAAPNKNATAGNERKTAFYKALVPCIPKRSGSVILEPFGGVGKSVLAGLPGFRHVAVEADKKRADSYKRAHKSATVESGDNVAWIKSGALDGMDFSAVDFDASANPFHSMEAFFKAADSSGPMLVTATWGYLGSSIREKGLNRQEAWKRMKRNVAKFARRGGYESRVLCGSFPSGLNQSNHVIYGAFSVVRPGDTHIAPPSGADMPMTKSFENLRPLEVPEAAYLAKRLDIGEVAGVLAKSEWGVDEAEPLVLCQKMECGTVVGWGTVQLSAPVEFVNGWEASDRVAKAVGPVEISKATESAGPVWYHTIYKVDLWDGPVVVKAMRLGDAGRLPPGVGSPWDPDSDGDPDVPHMMQPEDDALKKAADGEHEHSDDSPLGEHSHQDEDDPDAVYQQKGAPDQREAGADAQHEIWAHWMRHLFECCTEDEGATVIPADKVERWRRQMETPYADLTEDEKDGDREQTDRVFAAMGSAAPTKKSAPRVITKSAVLTGWMPEQGSGLPREMEIVVPGALRYWEHGDPEDRALFRDLLVKSDLFDGGNYPIDSGELSRVSSEEALESPIPGGERRQADGASNAIHDQILKALSEPMPIYKASDSADKEWAYVLSVALEANDGQDGNPLNPDAHNDVISEEELQEVAHEFARDFRRFGEQHETKLGEDVIRFADSFVLPAGWKMQTDTGQSFDHPVWLVGADVRRSSDLWKKIESGKINAWSIDGRGLKVPEQVKVSNQ